MRLVLAALSAAIAVALVSVTGVARAQDDALPLSLPETLVRADREAPEVTRARRAVRESEARRIGAGVIMPVNPRLSVDARPPLTGAFPSGVGYSASVDFLFEVSGAGGARIREAAHHTEVARADLAVQRLHARADAWTAYLHVQVSDQRIALAQSAEHIAVGVLDASRKRAAAGAAGDIEPSTATLELALVRAMLASVLREREVRIMELRETLDLEATRPIELTTALPDPPNIEDKDAAVATALTSRPELGVIRSRVSLLDVSDERLAKEAFPKTGFYVGVDSSPSSVPFGIVGVSVELPVAQRNQGPRAMVAESRASELVGLSLSSRRIAREVLATRAAYSARVAELKVLDDDAVPAAERTFQLVEQGWRAGRLDIFRVSSAARDLASVRDRRLSVLEAAWTERIALAGAMGVVQP